MRKDFDSVEASYLSHSVSYQDYAQGQRSHDIAQTWLQSNTLNAHRCRRMYALTDPLIALFPDSQWLTIGDGRYGSDAMYLKSKGVSVMATDLCAQLLEEAYQQKLIDQYQSENAEHLSFANDTFDFVYCKESYHHFPRPTIALYEMLRVAKHGVILLEPIDREIIPWYQTVILRFKNSLKKLLNKPVARDFFEEEGNYLYSVSKREFEKIALGLGYSQIVFKGLNDVYLHNMEFTPFDQSQPLVKKWSRKQFLYDCLSKMGLIPYNLLWTALMKTPLSTDAVHALQLRGYEVVTLPQNPYLKQRVTSMQLSAPNT